MEAAAQMDQMYKNPPENGNTNFGKWTVLTYAFKNLTNFEYEVHTFTGNGYVECGFKKL